MRSTGERTGESTDNKSKRLDYSLKGLGDSHFLCESHKDTLNLEQQHKRPEVTTTRKSLELYRNLSSHD
jgi:hypothetical protein